MQKAEFKPGDIIKVSQKMTEGKRERVVSFEGVVTKLRGKGENTMFTVRQYLEGIGVDRIIPLALTNLVDIKILNGDRPNRGNLPRKLDIKNSRKYKMR